jgi:predicted amidohydrolase
MPTPTGDRSLPAVASSRRGVTTVQQISVATCQVAPVYGSQRESLQVVTEALAWAEEEGVDVLCFPECFLTGYFRTRSEAEPHTVDLDSLQFASLLRELAEYEPTLVLGLIERSGTTLYNSAVVVEHGRLVGRYRKQHPHEPAFEPGDASPIFEKRGVKFGINICSDARFPETARRLAERGASIIFYPLNNSLPPSTADKWRSRHIEYLVERARDCSAWVISSDVVELSAERVGYGCTAIVDPTGAVVERCDELRVGRIMSRIAA